MRRQTITKEEVYAAADKIVDMGLNPTQSAVIRRVGGSYSTIGRFMEEWRRERRAANENPTMALPDQLQGSARIFAEEIWRKALDMATTMLRDHEKRLEDEQRVVDEDRLDIMNLVRDLEESAVTQATRIEFLERSGREAETNATALKDEARKAHERAVVAEARLIESNRRIEDLLESVAHAHQRNADLLQSVLSSQRRKRRTPTGHAHS